MLAIIAISAEDHDRILKSTPSAIAKYSARGKQYLVMIRPIEDGLILDGPTAVGLFVYVGAGEAQELVAVGYGALALDDARPHLASGFFSVVMPVSLQSLLLLQRLEHMERSSTYDSERRQPPSMHWASSRNKASRSFLQ